MRNLTTHLDPTNGDSSLMALDRIPSMRIEDLDDVRVWIANHDGKVNVLWETQHKRNDEQDRRDREVDRRLSAVERKIIYASGFAAAAGSIVGAVLVGAMKALA